MNDSRHILILSLIIAATNFYAAGDSRASQKVATNSVTAAKATPSIPISVFESNLPNGRDPFFPHSQRRVSEKPTTNSSTASILSSLMLQGISTAAGPPLATINYQTFAPGEDGEVITPGGRLKIHCEEINPDSVVITIGGGRRLELKLPQRY